MANELLHKTDKTKYYPAVFKLKAFLKKTYHLVLLKLLTIYTILLPLQLAQVKSFCSSVLSCKNHILVVNLLCYVEEGYDLNI